MSTDAPIIYHTRPKRSVIYDPIHPTDFRTLNIVYTCEQCSHFSASEHRCTIGYESALHVKSTQDRHYELSGRVAFCRFAEID